MPDEAVLMECAHSIIDVVPRLTRLMSKDLRLHSSGLFTSSQFRVMVRLFREGPQCLSRLAEYMGVSLPTMSKLVPGLESRGLISRHRDPQDRRRVLLALTDAGVEAYTSLLECTESHIGEWISHLSPAECHDIVAALAILDQAFAQVELPESYEAEDCSASREEVA